LRELKPHPQTEEKPHRNLATYESSAPLSRCRGVFGARSFEDAPGTCACTGLEFGGWDDFRVRFRQPRSNWDAGRAAIFDIQCSHHFAYSSLMKSLSISIPHVDFRALFFARSQALLTSNVPALVPTMSSSRQTDECLYAFQTTNSQSRRSKSCDAGPARLKVLRDPKLVAHWRRIATQRSSQQSFP